MLLTVIIILGIAGTIGFTRRKPMVRLDKVLLEHIDRSRHCLIDIRDFIPSSRRPVVEAENIPLSYLNRRAKSQALCEKKVVLIADDIKAAKAAARIIRKNQENQHSFYYVLQ